MKEYFGISNDQNNYHIVDDDVNINFSIKNEEILNLINGGDSKTLFQMIPEPQVGPFNYSITPIIAEHFYKLNHILIDICDNEPITHRKAFSAVGIGLKNVNVEYFTGKIEGNKKKFPLVSTLIQPIYNKNQYKNSVWVSSSLCRNSLNRMKYTFYRLIKYYNKHLKRNVYFTAEIDFFIGGIPVELKSFYKPKFLNFSVTRDAILKSIEKQKKIVIALQCKRAEVNDILLVFHDCKKMRIEHFTLKAFMVDIEKEVETLQNKEDSKFAKAVRSFETDMEKYSR